MVPRCLKIAAAIAAIAVLGVIGYGGAVYFGLLPFPFFSDQPEHSARYYPDDVIAYSWLSLNPGNGQRKHLADMLDRVRDYSSVREAENEAEDALEEALDTDFEEVLAWIGSALSFAVIDPGWDGLPAMAGTVAVRDREAAEDFIDDLRDLLVDTSYSFVEFDEDDYGEFETWVAEDGYGDAIAIALSDNLLVVASDEPTLESILDRVSGKQTRTLAGSERFQEARAALPDRRFLSLYVDAGSLQNAAGEWSGLPVDALGVAGMTGSPCGALAPTPDWIAVSVGAVERGVTMELVTPLTPGEWPEAPGLPDAAELLPDDTLGFAALSFNPSVEEWREALGLCTIADLLGEDLWDEVLAGVPADDQLALFDEVARMGRDGAAPPAPEPFGYDATLADVLDLALWAMSTLAGFDMESDLLDHLRGGVVVGVLSLDDDLAGAPDVAAMLAYREGSSGALGDTMALLAQRLVDDLGLGLDSADVGAEHRALVVEPDDPEGGGLAPGYVLHDGYLTFSTTRSALEAIVSRQKGDGDALADDGEYRRATAHLPGRPDMLTYLNLRRLVSAGHGADLIDRRAGDALEEILGSAAVSAGSDDHVSRVTFALTLFPEG